MLLTEHAVYRQTPKTGTHWIKAVLAPIASTVPDYKNYTFNHRVTVPVDCSDKNIYAFVRNPWSWYVSLYNFLRSHNMPATPADVLLLKELAQQKNFSEFVYELLYPHKIQKQLQALRESNIAQSTDVFEYHELWLDKDCSYGKFILTEFSTGCTLVGQYENLAKDLTTMIVQSKELTVELLRNIKTIPAQNTSAKVDYRDYYSTELANAVGKDMKDFNERFDYEF